MARTGKIGIDYFSHDVNMRSDPKVRLLIAKCGSDGYSVYNMLLESAYAENGYYLQLSDDYNILFSNDCKIDFNAYILILNECINTGLFCDELHTKYSILTSRRIQKNYIDATQRRKEVSFLKEYLLVNPAEMYPERVNVSILNLNARINPQNADIGTQRERKEKVDRKKKERKEPAPKKYLVANSIDWINQEIWEEWIDHKRKVKASVGSRALKKNVNDLELLGANNANAIIEQSIDEGWKGLFALKTVGGSVGHVKSSTIYENNKRILAEARNELEREK